MFIALAAYVVASYIGVGIWARKTRGPVALWAWFLSPVSAPALALITLLERLKTR